MADDTNNLIPQDNEEDNLVELIDENGEHTFFEHLATLEYEGESYIALCDPEAEDDDIEVFILKIDQVTMYTTSRMTTWRTPFLKSWFR